MCHLSRPFPRSYALHGSVFFLTVLRQNLSTIEILNFVEGNRFLMKAIICTFVECLHISRQHCTFAHLDGERFAQNVVVCTFEGVLLHKCGCLHMTLCGFCTFHGSTRFYPISKTCKRWKMTIVIAIYSACLMYTLQEW